MDGLPLHCLNCGYNLSGCEDNVCSECGSEFDVEEIQKELYRRLVTLHAALKLGAGGYSIWALNLWLVAIAETQTGWWPRGNELHLAVFTGLALAAIFRAGTVLMVPGRDVLMCTGRRRPRTMLIQLFGQLGLVAGILGVFAIGAQIFQWGLQG